MALTMLNVWGNQGIKVKKPHGQECVRASICWTVLSTKTQTRVKNWSRPKHNCPRNRRTFLRRHDVSILNSQINLQQRGWSRRVLCAQTAFNAASRSSSTVRTKSWTLIMYLEPRTSNQKINLNQSRVRNTQYHDTTWRRPHSISILFVHLGSTKRKVIRPFWSGNYYWQILK